MTRRRAKLELVEATDATGLETIEHLVRADRDGVAEFGAFYGEARTRLAPLLSADRRVWLLRTIDGDVGFLDADRVGDDVGIAFFVAAAHRRQGIAGGAIGRLIGMVPWPQAGTYTATVGARNLASRETLRSVGFVLVGTDDAGHLVWRRSAARRDRSGPGRFLDGAGRIDRYPVRQDDLHELLSWVADRALPHAQVWREAEINERLRPWAPGEDVAVLRRHLVDAEILERTRSGSEYARVADSAR